jgi:hypothetical protein
MEKNHNAGATSGNHSGGARKGSRKATKRKNPSFTGDQLSGQQCVDQINAAFETANGKSSEMKHSDSRKSGLIGGKTTAMSHDDRERRKPRNGKEEATP